MLVVDTYLAPSRLDGIGLFTRHDLAAGSVFWELMPQFDRLIEVEVYEAISGPLRTYLEMYCYPYVNDRRYLVFETDDARFMNHSEQPNCDVSSGSKGIVLHDIPAGSELTCDYRVFLGDALEMLPTRNGAQRAAAAPAPVPVEARDRGSAVHGEAET